MKVLLICTVAPYPKNVGKKIVLGGFCDYFRMTCAPGKFQVMCFEPADLGPDVEVFVLDKPGVVRKVLNLGFLSMIARKKSIQESLFWSHGALRSIVNRVTTFRPDIVVFDTVRTGQYFAGMGKGSFKSVLYMEDLFSVRYQRILRAMAEFPGADIDAMGNFTGNIPHALLPVYRSSEAVKRLLLRIEQRLVERSECVMPADFDLALLINEDEVRSLKARVALDNVHSISPMLVTNHRRLADRSWSGRPEFVFLGSLNLAHNAFSIENFIERHMDEMLAAMPECLLRIIGKYPSKNLVRLAAKYEKNVAIDGFVEDLDAVLSSCAAMIAPLLFGSGVKIKMIDAVRLGVPVVSTTYGAEGISMKATGGILVDDDLSRFADICRQLLDPEANKRHSDLSRLIYLTNYSEEAVKRQYEKFFHT